MAALLGIAGGVAGFGQEAAADRGDLSVIVVGAGAAGMSAAHLLTQRGVDVRVLEARPAHGGRIERRSDWVDFPIPLGAEWLHGRPSALRRIVADPRVDIATEVVRYDPDDLSGWFQDGELTLEPIGGEYTDRKFVGSSWLDFFDTYVLPGIADRISVDTPVTRIRHGGRRVAVTDARGRVHRADAVIVTVPITILRDGDIDFVPPLPARKRAALDAADVWGGIKVFVEFSERFYPAFVEFPDSDTRAGQRLYYDASYAQRSDANVLGLFAVGAQARPYQARRGARLRRHILGELDEVFDGAASRTYIRHLARNWDDEPFIRQAYLSDHADWRGVRVLGRPVGDRLYFAGDAYTRGGNWSEVHVAARSARRAVQMLLTRL